MGWAWGRGKGGEINRKGRKVKIVRKRKGWNTEKREKKYKLVSRKKKFYRFLYKSLLIIFVTIIFIIYNLLLFILLETEKRKKCIRSP